MLVTKKMVLAAVRDETQREHVLSRHFVSIETARERTQDYIAYSNSVFDQNVISPKRLFAFLENFALKIKGEDLEKLGEEKTLIKFFKVKDKPCGTKVSWHKAYDKKCNFIKVIFKIVTEEFWDEEELRVKRFSKVYMASIYPVPQKK